MDAFLLVCLALSFCSTFIMTYWWIRRARSVHIVGKDMNKLSQRKVAEMGGVPVLFGFIIGAMGYLWYRTFFNADFSIEILGVVGMVSIIGIIGIIDDLLGWKLGLRQYQKPLLCLFAALPLAVTQVGTSVVTLPVLGTVDLGIFYFLIIVPIAVSGAANAFNMIAGYNGLEAGMGIIILSALGLIAWVDQGLGEVAMLSGIMVACLFAFYLFNSFPAKIFPGDSMTYVVGALIAAVSILGNTEKIALFLFLPYFLQFFLKARGGWRKEGFSRPDRSSRLTLPEGRIYGIEHLMVWAHGKKATEQDVVLAIFSVELFLVLLVMIDIII